MKKSVSRLFCLNVVFGMLVLLVAGGCMNDGFEKEKYGNCSDNIQNQREEGVDCGGPCMSCASCDDGVKNSGEVGIDCGGNCATCEPNCTVPVGTIQYTLFPSSFPSGYNNTQNLYGTANYFANNSEIDIDFSGGGSTGLIQMTLKFQDQFNPVTYLSLNETMVFKTVDASDFTVSNKNNVKVTYYGNFGFSGFNGGILRNQSIYLTKINSTQVRIRFCELKAQKDIFSIDALAD